MTEPVHFLFRWQQRGGHVHVGVWVEIERQAQGKSRAKAGDLVFDPHQWMAFLEVVGIKFGGGHHVQFVQEPAA